MGQVVLGIQQGAWKLFFFWRWQNWSGVYSNKMLKCPWQKEILVGGVPGVNGHLHVQLNNGISSEGIALNIETSA